jgi:type II secretory pathway component GspD/PulD (secretin)
MKASSKLLILAALLCGAGFLIWNLRVFKDQHSTSLTAAPRTLSSFDLPAPGDKITPAGMLKFEQAELAQVLNIYAEISSRSIIRSGTLPEVKFTFSNQTPMSPVEVLRALDTILAAQGIVTVPLGTQFIKVVAVKEAHLEAGPVIELPPDQLPDSSSFLIYVVKMKNIAPSRAIAALQPFARLPNSIMAIDAGRGGPPTSKANLPVLPPSLFGVKDKGIIILRDYSSNVRQMLQVLKKLEAE